MKVEILDEAQQDLIEGFHFYERQAQDVGDYFLDSLFSDVDSLQIYSVPESCPFARVGGIPSAHGSTTVGREMMDRLN